MNIISKAIAASMLLGAALPAAAQDNWLHLYYNNENNYRQFPMTSVTDITFDQTNGTMTVNTADYAEPVGFGELDNFVIGPNVPAIRVATTDTVVGEIFSKTVYLNGTVSFEGRGIYDDFTAPVKIRGRGNSTWGYPKRPYRLKFNEKLKVGSVKKGKNLVLLANYIDPSMMRNFVAFKVEELLGMAYPNHAMPVDVYLNDIYKGSYMATEKVGFNNGSVDIPKEQEATSILFELDNNVATEDEFPFESAIFDYDYGLYLPVRIKDPDAPVDATEATAWFDKWSADFDSFMDIVSGGNEAEIFEACDLESLVKFIITFNVCCNQELNHPKSVYLYKTEGGKYFFGPCWDFDWAFGYQPTYSKGNSWGWWNESSYPSYENPLLGFGKQDTQGDGMAGVFFYRLCNTQAFQQKYAEVWNDFYTNHLEEFWQAFDAYAELLLPSAQLQRAAYTPMQSRDKFSSSVAELRSWVENRIEYINTDANHGLWTDEFFPY